MATEKAHLHFGTHVTAASPALVALLASGDQFIMADLYTITLLGGSVLRYSAAATALSANGYMFEHGPKFERSKTRVVIGTHVDELEIKIYPETTDLVGTTPFLKAATTSDVEILKLLLEWGADPYVTNRNGTNALMMSAGLGWRVIFSRGSQQEAIEAVKESHDG